MRNKAVKKRIAIVAPRYGVAWRGVETFTDQLQCWLSDEFEVTVFSRQNNWCVPEEKWPKVLKRLGKWHVDPQELEMLTFTMGCLIGLTVGKYDVILVQSGWWGALGASLVRKVVGTPFVYRSAGGMEPVIVWTKPDVYVATTPQIAQWIEAYSPNQRVVMIPNGVDLHRFRGAKGQRSKVRKYLKVLCVGALIPHKRIELAIEAVATIPGAKLTVIGEGPERSKIYDLGIKKLGKARFKLIEKVPYERMPEYYRKADVFTLPSWEEPFGIVYLEAMASGLPVVAPDDPSRRWLIGKNGSVCDVDNPIEYGRTIEKAIKLKVDPQILEKFDWKRIGARYKQLVRAIIRE